MGKSSWRWSCLKLLVIEILGLETTRNLADETYLPNARNRRHGKIYKVFPEIANKGALTSSLSIEIKFPNRLKKQDKFKDGWNGVAYGSDDFKEVMNETKHGAALLQVISKYEGLDALVRMEPAEKKRRINKFLADHRGLLISKALEDKKEKRKIDDLDVEDDMSAWTVRAVLTYISQTQPFFLCLVYSLWDSCASMFDIPLGVLGLLHVVRYVVIFRSLSNPQQFGFYVGSSRLVSLIRRYCGSIRTHFAWGRPVAGSFLWYFQTPNSPSDQELAKHVRDQFMLMDHITPSDHVGLAFDCGLKHVNSLEICMFKAEKFDTDFDPELQSLTGSMVTKIENAQFFNVSPLLVQSNQVNIGKLHF